MNRADIKQILNTPGLNMYQVVVDNHHRKFTYFNPVTSQYVEFDAAMWRNHNRVDLYISNVVELVDSCYIKLHHQNFIKHYRSFILAMLIAGMRRYNNARLILCKSESAAKNYSNLGGVVVCIHNPRAGKQWGVVK